MAPADPGTGPSARRAARRTALGTSVIIAAVALVIGLRSNSGSTVRTATATEQLDATTIPPVAVAETSAVAGSEGTGSAATGSEVLTSTMAATADTSESITASTTKTASTTETASTAPSSTTIVARNPAETATSQPISLSPGAAPCPAADGSTPRRVSFTVAPPMCIDPQATYKATITTSEGALVFELDPAVAPLATNNFVYLARYKFYDGLTIHRVLPDFVIQGGDPLANGTGGPGYEFADELPPKPGYPYGTLGMAGGGEANPNLNGSQFFVAIGSLAESLKGEYTRFGRLLDGRRTLRTIAALGPKPSADGAATSADEEAGKPTKVITIRSITITATGEKNPGAGVPGSSTAVAPSSTTTKKP